MFLSYEFWLLSIFFRQKNKHLRSLPVVDTPENMILLGSVQRHELIKMIDKHIGREKRLEVAAKWQKEAQERAREELEKLQKEVEEGNKSRRSSRFEVVPTPNIAKLRELAINEMLPPQAKKGKETINNPNLGSFPRKSILKKTNSFNLRHFSTLASTSPSATPYSTITAAESRLRSAFDVIFRKSATLQDAPNQKSSIEDTEHDSGDIAVNSSTPTSPQTPVDSISFSPNVSKKVQLVSDRHHITLHFPLSLYDFNSFFFFQLVQPRERVIDMSPEDQKLWETEEMNKSIDLDAANIKIDPSPFQLVEKTSILKVHSLFSMIGINHAYVTHIGKLVGVVALKEVCRRLIVARNILFNWISNLLFVLVQLRKAIEDVNSGNLTSNTVNSEPVTEKQPMTPEHEKLLNASNNNVHNTVSSMESTISNSDNCSDVELGNIRIENNKCDTKWTQRLANHNEKEHTKHGIGVQACEWVHVGTADGLL